MLNADALTLESAVDPIIGHEKHEQPRGGGGMTRTSSKLKPVHQGQVPLSSVTKKIKMAKWKKTIVNHALDKFLASIPS